ncbi:lysozyme [Croceibacterium sp. TMG7-5b_MA50]|uniref:lysozyme n=1 Tax=Croceibacterium sp. TMG7-5b_MA50 TaxID=3121290 RepID=UPI003221C5D5
MDRKMIFDAVRGMLGRGFSHAEVTRLDSAIDNALALETAAPRAIGEAGLQLIQVFEGCARRRTDGSIEAYPDPGTGGAPWTIGWGSTTDENGTAIAPGTVWTQARCDARFAGHVAEFAEQVDTMLGETPTSPAQFDALVSLAYNIGVRALETSTLLRLHRAGDHAAAAAQFARWNRAGGRVMAGLTRRRTAEAALYRDGNIA